uniref:branched-chain amino acid ABC transporter permease n=1 Tax=Modestobacter roseus TaxID=1181884 RepID=UPI001324A986
VGAPWGASVVRFGDIALPTGRVVAAGVTVVAFAALWYLFSRTDLGVGMRAAAADGPTASLMGIRLSRTAATGWALAGVLAAVAGVFLTSFPSPGVAPTIALSAFAAIPAWVLGGFDSVPGAVVGGLVIGLTSALVTGYESDLEPYLGSGFGEVAPYVVMIIVLLVRPSGLLGSKEAVRV